LLENVIVQEEVEVEVVAVVEIVVIVAIVEIVGIEEIVVIVVEVAVAAVVVIAKNATNAINMVILQECARKILRGVTDVMVLDTFQGIVPNRPMSQVVIIAIKLVI